MRRPRTVPDELKHGPITIADAKAAGFSPGRLRASCWKRVAWGVYVWAGGGDRWDSVVFAWHRRLPWGAVFSGSTAARIHGLDIGGLDRVEVTMPRAAAKPTGKGLQIRRGNLEASDVVAVRGLRVTSPLRTWFDLARLLPVQEAVAAVDWALHKRMFTAPSLAAYIADHPRLRGVPQARRALELADARAESLMESRLRVLLVKAGLPPPEVQYPVTDAMGCVRRIDMCYPDSALGIEYDGDLHRSTLVDDNRRQNWLLDRGFVLLRYTASDVFRHPQELVAQVRSHLHSADCRHSAM